MLEACARCNMQQDAMLARSPRFGARVDLEPTPSEGRSPLKVLRDFEDPLHRDVGDGWGAKVRMFHDGRGTA